MSNISKGDWIDFGNYKRAVICQVYDEENIEVVYLDERDRAINEDMKLINGKWEFKIKGPCGGYADKYTRLSKFVAILRRGEHF